LNAQYKAAEKENRQPKGILRNVGLTVGPYNKPGGAYMFYGTRDSYIEFPNNGGLDTHFSITLMCWVQPGVQGASGPLFTYTGYPYGPYGVLLLISYDQLFIHIVKHRPFQSLTYLTTAEVLPAGEWVHVAASYDHNTGINSLYINGHLKASQNISIGYEIATASQRVRMGAEDQFPPYFKGKIAEMKVYDVALNEAQIQTSMRQGSCTFIFLEIVFSLSSPVSPLINETAVIGHFWKRLHTPVSGSHFAKECLAR